MALEDKIILVTEAAKNFGDIISKIAIEQDMKVIAVSENISKLEELDDYANRYNNKMTLVKIDLTKFDQINSLAKEVFLRYGKLDFLFSNHLAMTGFSPVTHFTHKTWQKIFNHNVHSNWHFLRNFESLLKLSNIGGAYFFSKSVSQRDLSYNAIYNSSIAAMESMVLDYAKENKKLKIKLVYPQSYEQINKSYHQDDITNIRNIFVNNKG